MRLKLTAATWAIAALTVCAAPASAEDAIKVRAYFGPGYNYFRAGADSIGAAGLKVELETVEGDWISAPALHQKVLKKDLLAGRTVTTAERRLTDAERKSGLDDLVLGYFGAVLIVHPDAPIDSVDAKKWQAVLASKSVAKLKWSDLGTVVAGKKDGPVTWSLPNHGFQDWARPLVKLRAMPEAVYQLMDKKSKLEPEEATTVVATKPDAIAVFGFNFVTQNLAHAQTPVKLLKFEGVAPTAATLADGTYPLSAPLVAVFAAKASGEPSSALGKLVTWLKSEKSKSIANVRALVPPKL